MKYLSETESLKRLSEVKAAFQAGIKTNYELRAKNCLTCETQGICCTDAHFVNVHITRLEAKAIENILDGLGAEKRNEVIERAKAAVEKYRLDTNGDATYSCPLFEPSVGCLVHKEAKPIPCIQHACYENKDDLPPDALQFEQEEMVQNLNTQTYGDKWTWAAIPVWLARLTKDSNTAG